MEIRSKRRRSVPPFASSNSYENNVGKGHGEPLAFLIVLLHIFLMLLTLNFLFTDIPADLWEILRINFLLMLVPTGLLLLIPMGFGAVVITNAVLFTGIWYLNEFVTSARGRPINYVDIFCISDALKVAGRYTPVFSGEIAVKLLIVVGLTALAVFSIAKFCPKTEHHLLKKSAFGAGTILISVATIALMTNAGILKTDAVAWFEDEYLKEKGLYYALYCEFVNSRVEEPEGYSKEAAENVLGKYNDDTVSDKMPVNVIAVMNEAFADYSLVGEPLFSEDPIPRIHALSENCAKGKLTVNVFGGQTCNSEFEFLTGNALAFLPNDSVPYMQLSLTGRPSLASEMKLYGYSADAVHPYYGQGWKRIQVYPGIGFDRFISGEMFADNYKKQENANLFHDLDADFGPDLEYIRGLVSDAECYRKVDEIIAEKNSSGQGAFVFAVTVQNHGGYLRDDFVYAGMTDYVDKEHADINQYLNLCRISDDAFCDWLERLDKLDEPTVVVMFGDHQPGLMFDLYSEKYSDEDNFWESYFDDYTVPYIMWANYDVEWERYDMLSVNYLSAVMKRGCGLPLTSFDKVRLAAMEEYPVISCVSSMDKNRNFVSTDSILENEKIKDYMIAQYYRLLG